MGWIRLCRYDTEVGFTPHYYYYCMLLLLLLLLLVLDSFNGLFCRDNLGKPVPER